MIVANCLLKLYFKSGVNIAGIPVYRMQVLSTFGPVSF